MCQTYEPWSQQICSLLNANFFYHRRQKTNVRNNGIRRPTVSHPSLNWPGPFKLLRILGYKKKSKIDAGLYAMYFLCKVLFLAQLSQRLTRWAYSIPMVHRPSVVRCPHFQTWIFLKPVGQPWSNFMCSITGVGERLHKVLGQIGSKLWFSWQQKASID